MIKNNRDVAIEYFIEHFKNNLNFSWFNDFIDLQINEWIVDTYIKNWIFEDYDSSDSLVNYIDFFEKNLISEFIDWIIHFYNEDLYRNIYIFFQYLKEDLWKKEDLIDTLKAWEFNWYMDFFAYINKQLVNFISNNKDFIDFLWMKV